MEVTEGPETTQGEANWRHLEHLEVSKWRELLQAGIGHAGLLKVQFHQIGVILKLGEPSVRDQGAPEAQGSEVTEGSQSLEPVVRDSCHK